MPVGTVRELGDRALLVGVEDAAAGRRLRRALVDALESVLGHGRGQVVGGSATVMVEVGASVVEVEIDEVRAEVVRVVAAPQWRREAAALDLPGRLVTIDCVFDGPDMAEVAETAGCTPDDVVTMLTATPLTVDVVGFSPGFAYLGGVPEPLRGVRRRASPRARVRPGSVALANGQAAVYPTASPGGWQLIGRTDEPMFTPWQPPYARLEPGDRVQFRRAESDDIPEPAVPPTPPWSAPTSAAVAFEVVQPGLRTLLQDGGRPGVASIGVPAAGPADPVSLALANRLVGNPAEAGALEITARGPTLRGVAPGYVAVVGARPEVWLGGQPVETGQVVPVAAGDVLEIGVVRQGFRTYVAVAGGLVGPTTLGSVSSDQLCGLGPGTLETGQLLHAGPLTPPLGDHLGADAPAGPLGDGPVTLRVVPGPHAEAFEPGVMEVLAAARFVVEDQSNRVGLRLRHVSGGPGPARAGGADELDSHGVVTGAVQLPPGGDPVVLLPDHATLGGYPVVAVVASVDHWMLGQCGPGTEVRFVPVDPSAARRAWARQRREVAGAVVGHYPLAVE